ncbi:Proteasome activator subunit 4 [Morella rubra]|uniref:Proteasome activator subunit 4 n=1 Tax=Morella rubra TaxID=262757 RepID=A0A6A1VQS0_9ROSI|nr:Proteasome activator subunit 4 [Morella rubra]
MHVYNAWLPPPVAEETKREKESFARVVRTLGDSYRPDDPDSVYSTLNWIPLIKLFIDAESEVALEDVATLVRIGLEVFNLSQNKLYVQAKWGNILARLINKYRKKLSLKVQWRPFYDTLVSTHFASSYAIGFSLQTCYRNTGPEGPILKQRHFQMITSLVQSCRRFFPPDSASEIWSEFRSLVKNPWHNSSFEGSGFLRLFLPTNSDNQEFFSCDWIKECIDLWNSVPNCHFWNCQWAGIIARVVKNCKFVDWECFLPTLFMRYLNMFEVPVANRRESYPFPLDVPINTSFLFPNKSVTLVKAIAKSIVYLLKPCSSAQEHLEKFVNLLEPFYHPSNGGPWTHSLERLLLHLVNQFQKRLKCQQLCRHEELHLGRSERTFFVNAVLKLMDRGQYSKDKDLSETVAATTSILSYVEPSLVLPFVVSRYHMALKTRTATHQLEIAVMSMAYVGRSLLLTSLSTSSIKPLHLGGSNQLIDIVMLSLSNALLGMDANDPPKTLATMQLIGSIFSNALRKISKFVKTNTLPGAIEEVGLLCCACIHSNHEEAVNHLVEPLLLSAISSLEDTSVMGCREEVSNASTLIRAKPTLSPALETTINYQLKVLSIAISYGGPALLRYKDQFKEAIVSSFDLGRAFSVTLMLCTRGMDSTKDYLNDEPMAPKWHIPSDGEEFANELLGLHLDLLWMIFIQYAKLEPFLIQFHAICHPGDKKEHLKVTLLRIDSSLQGVLPCLPDFNPSSGNGLVEDPYHASFLIAGARGSSVGSAELREKAAAVIHAACKYLLEEEADDSILLTLVIRIMDALVNYGSFCFDEWSGQAWNLESSAIIEPPINFIVSLRAKGKRRAAGKSLLKMIKRWPSIISKCVLSLTENLRDSSSPEHAVLGSCAILSSKKVLKHLAMDQKLFSSFILGVLSSSHHESLKVQKAINELFVTYNIHFAGVSSSIFRTSDYDKDPADFANLVSQLVSMGSDSSSLHWRYNLMANRVLLFLAMTSRDYLSSSSEILSRTAGHFLKNLKCQLPQTRIIAISALNKLLKESPYKLSAEEKPFFSDNLEEKPRSSLERALMQIFQEDGFFTETLNSLALVHITTDTESSAAGGNSGNSIFKSQADKSIACFYFDFSASWPRTPSWISVLNSSCFKSKFARIFKRLVQECGMPVLLPLRTTLKEFANAKERSKQSVAAEAFAGILHSDVHGILGAWDSWMMVQLQNIILTPLIESVPEWAACIRYAVCGKGRYGAKIPVLRQQILDCLAKPLPPKVTTTIVANRYAFLSAALIELSPQKMSVGELQLQNGLLQELLGNMRHSSSQVRETIGVTLSVLCSNIRLYVLSGHHLSHDGANNDLNNQLMEDSIQILTKRTAQVLMNIQNTSLCANMETSMDISAPDVHLKGDSQDDVKWMETVFHFIISSLKSGRSSCLLDVIVRLLYPVLSLQVFVLMDNLRPTFGCLRGNCRRDVPLSG